MEMDLSRVNLLERDIEDYLFENPEHVLLYSYPIIRWIARQYRVPSGIIDLLGTFGEGHLAVVEVKNVAIDASAIAQVCRYAHDIGEINWRAGLVGHVHKVVIGRSIDNQAMAECYAMEVFPIIFSAHLSLDINSVHWSREYRNIVKDSYAQQAVDDVFSSLCAELESKADKEESAIEACQIPDIDDREFISGLENFPPF